MVFKITLIAAMSINRTIGLNNTMPWHIPEDLAHFKARTLGKVMIMGKNTFQSIGKPLPGRDTIIVSTQLQDAPCPIVKSLDEAINLAKTLRPSVDEIIIAGGGQIYAAALSCATHMSLTHIKKDIAGDTFFPQWADQEWQLDSKQDHTQSQEPHLRYSFSEYSHRTRKPCS